MKMSFSDNKVGTSGQASETIGGQAKPEEAGDSAAKQGKDAHHMRKAVATIVEHNKLMSDNPDMYKKAHAHVQKHGHKAMDMLPKQKITSVQDLRDAANSSKEFSKEMGEGQDTIVG